jgi:hypothetical protein
MLDEGEIRSSVVVFGRSISLCPRTSIEDRPPSARGLTRHDHRVTTSLIRCADAIHAQALSGTPAPQKGFPWRDQIFNSPRP